ncbi:MAG: VOC family protein [Candidatus Dormibacteraeota bacterium]|nr:VOC family protein [Candidatus Dormibacteraeota bacterium]
MERVTGVGGVFIKARDPAALAAWYRDHLGFEVEAGSDAVAVFRWAEPGTTTWSAFPDDTRYFGRSTLPSMVNYRVANLNRMLEQLRGAGAVVDDHIEDSSFGRFGWATDPEGNRFELWEPAAGL